MEKLVCYFNDCKKILCMKVLYSVLWVVFLRSQEVDFCSRELSLILSVVKNSAIQNKYKNVVFSCQESKFSFSKPEQVVFLLTVVQEKKLRLSGQVKT